MKKKLLSLLLVLCMVIPMVPMTVLAADTTVTFYDVDGGVLETVSANYGDLVECPAYSVEGETFLGWDVNGDGTADYSPDGTIVVQRGYTEAKAVVWVAPDEGHVPVVGEVSAFRDNLPAVDGTSVVFNGHWQVGSYPDAGGNFTAFDTYASDTPNGGPRFVPASAGGSIWSKGGMYVSTDVNNPTRYYASAIADGHADALVYSFIRDAEIKVDFNNVAVCAEGAPGINLQVEFAIYKNGTKEWPEGDGWHLYDCGCTTHEKLNDWTFLHTGITLKEDLALSVEAGDEISFRVRRAGEKKVWLANMAPSIEFVDVDENSSLAPEAPDPVVTKTSSSEHQAKVEVEVKGGSTAMFSGNWSYVSYHKDSMDTTYTLDIVRPMGDGDYLREDVSDIYLTDIKSTSWGKEGGYYGAVHPGRNDYWGYGDGTHTFAAHYLYTAGWRYVTEHAGVISIDITALSTLSAAIIANGTAAGNAAASFAIFHNGKMIWPVVDGQYNAKADWFYSASQVANTRVDILAEAKETNTYASLSNVFVEKGDEITFLVRGGDGYGTCRGNHMGMDITYKHIFTENTVFVSEKGSTNSEILEKGDSFTFPEYKGNNLLIFGGWDIDDDGEADCQPGDSITLTGNVAYAGVENGAYVYEKGGEKVVYTKGDTFTFPEYTGELLGFRGWDANGDGGVDYAPGDEVTVTAEIAYSAVAIDLSFSRDEMAIVNNKLVMPFGWKFVAHNSTNYANAYDMNTVLVNANGGTTGALTGDSFIGTEKSIGLSVWDGNGYPLIGWHIKKDRDTEGGPAHDPEFCWGQWGSIYASSNWNAGLCFTAPNPGYITINIDSLSSTSNKKFLAVFVDGTMIWPKDGGSYTNSADWYQLAARGTPLAATVIDVTTLPDLELLENIFVAGGQKIEIMVKSNRGLGNGTLIGASIEYDQLFPTDQPYIKIAGVKEPVILEEGERYTLPAYTGEGAFLGWDADGDGDVDYTDEATITMPGEVLLLNPVLAGSTSFHGNLPTYNADNSVTYNGGWKAGVYDIGAGKFIPFNYGQSAEVRFSFNNKPWDGSTAAMYSTGRFAMSDTVVADGRYNVAVQYTAEMSGNITVDFASLQLQRETNPSDKRGYVSGGFAIYHNGIKIAPVDAEYYYYKSANSYAPSNNPKPTDEGNLLAMFRADGELNLDVKKGDTIEVRAFKDDGASRMFIINPTINYNEVPSKPIVTGGGVTVGQVPLKHGYYATNILTANQTFEFIDDNSVEYVEGFTLDIYASLNAPRTDYVKGDAGEEGFKIPYGVLMMYYNEKGEFGMVPATWVQDNTAEGAFFADVDFMFRLPAVSAKDLSTNYIVMPLIIYEDGSTYPNVEDTMQYGDIRDLLMLMEEEGELFSVSKYATLVLESPETDNEMKKTAGALLNYAAAANEYFDVEPFEFLVPDEMPVLPSITPKDVYNLTEFDGKAEISGATLVVEETISMRIYVDSTANISGWALQMDEDASFETPRNLKNLVLKRNSNGKYYVDVEIPTVNFGDAFYFRVVDQNGDQQSGVLTYSVESYVARMQGTGSAELLDLLDAMLTLCKVANDVA